MSCYIRTATHNSYQVAESYDRVGELVRNAIRNGDPVIEVTRLKTPAAKITFMVDKIESYQELK